jgi:hypothetical protein
LKILSWIKAGSTVSNVVSPHATMTDMPIEPMAKTELSGIKKPQQARL